MSFARKSTSGKPKPRLARNTPPALAAKGWTAKAAAEHLGCDISHLWRVVRGYRVSRRLSAQIAELPNIKDKVRKNQSAV